MARPDDPCHELVIDPVRRLRYSPTVTRGQARKRIDELSTTIRHHDRRYYIEAQPDISDERYDELFRELERLEQEFSDLREPDSPTQRVGGEPAAELTRAAAKKTVGAPVRPGADRYRRMCWWIVCSVVMRFLSSLIGRVRGVA